MDFRKSIQLVKTEYDIVEYVKMNGISLEKAGTGKWKGLCPFHSEKTPSFTISEDFQNYHCFGCGESGDIISFAKHIHSLNFVDTLKMLAEEKGIHLEISHSEESKYDVSVIRSIVAEAHKFFQENFKKLDESHPAKLEIKKRKLTLENEVYGYSLEAPNELYKHLKKKGYKDKDIEDSQLVMFFDDGRQPWDFFHGRLMIVINDYLGRPVSFTSRKIFEDDKMKGKYVNGKESSVFLKKSTLFGADKAKKSARENKKVIVVEGQFDEISLRENGIENVVATSGTAFTEEHANLLLRMVGKSGQIVFVQDGDKAGSESMAKIFLNFPILHTQSRAVHLEDGRDPCDYILDFGVESFTKEVEKSETIGDFVVNHTINNLGGEINSSNRQEFVYEIAKYARATNNTHIKDMLLGKASIISAFSIDSIRDIVAENKAPVKSTKKSSEESRKLDLKIKLDGNSSADRAMFVALASLVRLPGPLLEITPETIHKKFIPFLSELQERYKHYEEKGSGWRFIEEEYEDKDFALALKNKILLEDPKEDVRSAKAQYLFLVTKANQVYKREHENMKRARALSSIADTTDPVKIANALNLYNSIQ